MTPHLEPPERTSVQRGDDVHLTTKLHETFEGTIVANDLKDLAIQTCDGSRNQFISVHIVPWDDVMYCVPIVEWERLSRLARESDHGRETDDSDSDSD